MKRSRFNEEQIISILKEQEARNNDPSHRDLTWINESQFEACNGVGLTGKPLIHVLRTEARDCHPTTGDMV